MKVKFTSRGFVVGTFSDSYNSECSLQESSSVDPHVWLGMDKNYDGNPVGIIKEDNTAMLVDGHVLGARMHLSQNLVKALLPSLQYFAEHGTLPHDGDETNDLENVKDFLETLEGWIIENWEEYTGLHYQEHVTQGVIQKARYAILQGVHYQKVFEMIVSSFRESNWVFSFPDDLLFTKLNDELKGNTE